MKPLIPEITNRIFRINDLFFYGHQIWEKLWWYVNGIRLAQIAIEDEEKRTGKPNEKWYKKNWQKSKMNALSLTALRLTQLVYYT